MTVYFEKAMKNQDGMGGNNQGMQRMPGPRGGPLGGPPRGHGMAGFGGMVSDFFIFYHYMFCY